MNPASPIRSAWWLWLGVALTALKLWLTRAQPIYAIGNAALDDRLFLQIAESLVRGDWLGPYTQATLAKGAGYPLFIALTFWLGIPLGLAQQGLYALACGLFARACRPALPIGACVAVYLVLLWNPMSYEAPTLGRVMRQHLVTPAAILIFAAFVALYLRRGEPSRRQWPWAALLGASLGAFWVTREEGVWILPGLLLLLGVVGLQAWRTSRAAAVTLLRSLVVAVAFFALPLLFICRQNAWHYGWFGLVEIKAPEFKSAYGALLRIKAGPLLDQVPVTRQAREAAYALSPAMAELQPHLESSGWIDTDRFPAGERQIRGGWFIWALRDSVAAAGHARDAREALAFYQRLADEINAACDAGRIPAHPPRHGLMPPWRDGQTAAVARTFVEFAGFTGSFTSFNVLPPLSIGDQEELKLFHDLTQDELASSPRAPALERPNQAVMRHRKYALLDRIGRFLCATLPALLLTAHVVAAARFLQGLKQRTLAFPLALALAAWISSAAFLLLNALVHVTSFSVLAVSTFAPVYPLLLVFLVAVAWDAAVAWWPGAGPAADRGRAPPLAGSA